MSKLNTQSPQEPAYFTWTTEKEKAKVFANMPMIDEHIAVPKSRAAYLDTFRNIDTNVSVRDGFGSSDYYYMRPDEAVPRGQKEIIRQCRLGSQNNGLVNNIITLMAEFACQGVDVVCSVPKHQKLYRAWFKKIHGKERSERFLDHLYRDGNVVVKRSTTKLKSKDIEKLRQAYGADIEYPNEIPVNKRDVPIKYTFLDCMALEVIGGELAAFTGKYNFALKISPNLRNMLSQPGNEEFKALLPKDLLNGISEGKFAQNIIPLDNDKLSYFFYKKDDWRIWARPMIAAILDDLKDLEKMKLADRATLDGIISQVRLWKLGSLAEKIYPNPAMMARLADILLNNTGGGVIDLIWGPDIELIESKAETYKSLGMDKYQPIYTSIFQGVGVPPTLTGASTQSGFTNNAISFKTLIERLTYGRNLLTEFWQQELNLFQRAMGIKTPAKVKYRKMTLVSEDIIYKIMLDLVDRGIYSEESLMEMMEEDFDLEKNRLRRIKKERDGGRTPRRGGPWNDAEFKESVEKLGIQGGTVAPEQVVDIKPKPDGVKTKMDLTLEMNAERIKQQKQSGVPGQGRPKNAKDKVKRKTKVVRPRTSADYGIVNAWTTSAQKQISDILTPMILEVYNKNNLRQLSNAEAEEFETIKFGVLFGLEPFSEINLETVSAIVNNTPTLPFLAQGIYEEMIQQYTETRKQPTVEELRQFQASVYTLLALGD